MKRLAEVLKRAAAADADLKKEHAEHLETLAKQAVGIEKLKATQLSDEQKALVEEIGAANVAMDTAIHDADSTQT